MSVNKEIFLTLSLIVPTPKDGNALKGIILHFEILHFRKTILNNHVIQNEKTRLLQA